jgi:hypothetical protein
MLLHSTNAILTTAQAFFRIFDQQLVDQARYIAIIVAAIVAIVAVSISNTRHVSKWIVYVQPASMKALSWTDGSKSPNQAQWF